jgi:hypothetical protein
LIARGHEILSPMMSDDDIRIVLPWGQNPEDV